MVERIQLFVVNAFKNLNYTLISFLFNFTFYERAVSF